MDQASPGPLALAFVLATHVRQARYWRGNGYKDLGVLDGAVVVCAFAAGRIVAGELVPTLSVPPSMMEACLRRLTMSGLLERIADDAYRPVGGWRETYRRAISLAEQV